MKIESSDKDINGLLSAGYFKIPRFQRPYSWDKENISDFWTDVVKREDPDYFIGSIVVYQQDKYHLGIVDGQQRLTTITILLCALRDAFEAVGLGNLALGVHGFVERKNVDNLPEFIVSPETSFPYFQEHIQKFDDAELVVEVQQEEKNIQGAYEFFRSELDSIRRKHLKPDATNDLPSLELELKNVRDLVLDLKVIFIKLENEDDAYLIFATLNTRGKDLATADLVKNHLTKLIKTKGAEVDVAKEKWAKIRQTIHESSEDLNLDNFLHHFWLAKHEYVALNKLFPLIKKNVTQANARSFMDDLLRMAPIYRSLFEPAYWKWSTQQRDIVSALRGMAGFRVKQQIPMTLAALDRYHAKKLSKKNVERCLSAIERFHFFFTAVTSSRSSGGISTMYAAAAQRLSSAENEDVASKAISDLRVKLVDRIPSYEEFSLSFSQLVYTSAITKDRRLIKYILSKMQSHFAPGMHYEFDAMSIEHIVPQSELSHGQVDASIVGQIGNLILLDPALNSKIGNKSFSEKRKILRANSYVFEPELADLEEFGETAIERKGVGFIYW